MRALLAAAAAFAALLGMPAVAMADAVDVTSVLLMSARQEPRDGRVYPVAPLYESFSLRASELKNPWFDDLKVVLSLWGEAIPGQPRDARHAAGDLDLGFVEGKLLERQVTLRVGRQLLFGGAARNVQMDGLNADARIWGGLGLSAYGGVPVTPRFGVSRGDALAGTRLYFRPSFDTEVGASFIHVMDDGRIARQEAGLDARYLPYRTVTLSGSSLWSTVEGRLAEGELAASWRALPELQLSGDFRRTAPDLFIPRSSIFSVFAQETRNELGGSAFYQPRPRIKLWADYHRISDDEGLGHRAGGKASVYLGSAYQGTLGAEAQRLLLPMGGYLQLRTFGAYRFSPAFFVSVDADTTSLDIPINGETRSYSSTASAGWDFAPGWRAMLTGVGGVSPFVRYHFDAMAKIAYNFAVGAREVRP